MQQSHADHTGEFGESDVVTFFKKLGWGPFQTHKQDLGSDLFVQIRDKDRVDLGMMLGVQVKTGDGAFKKTAMVDDRKGWWFREGDQRHREYWSDHDVAHILIVQNYDLDRRYWARLDRTTIESTGKGIRVFVPEDQPVTPDSADVWVEIVREAQRRASFQGESWNFKISQVPEKDWARYALLAPRIVAPHLNQGVAGDINWAEATALCLRSEHHRWDEFAVQRPGVPSVREAAESDNVGWRFAAAVHGWTFGKTDELEALSNLELPISLRIPHAVLLSLVLEQRGDAQAAEQLLTTHQVGGVASVDQAWLALQRGWQLFEAGRFELADEQIRSSVAMHGSLSSGLLNSAIRSAGILSLFQMAPVLSGDIAAAVQAADTTTSWWQTQQVESALNSFLRHSFDGWLREVGVLRFGQGDSTHNDLLSAERVAWLTGNRRSSRYAAFLRALANLVLPQGDHAPPEQQLASLRRAGYRNEMRRAIRKIRRDGPLSGVREFMEDVSPDRSTTTTIHSDLEALDEAGGYLSPEGSAAWMAYLIEALNDPEGFAKRFGFHSDPRPELLGAVAGLYVSFDDQAENALLDLLMSLADSSNHLFERPVQRILRSVSEGTISARSEELFALVTQLDESNWLGKLLLEATRGTPAGRSELSRRILGGELSSTLAGLAMDELAEEEAMFVLGRAHAQLIGFIGQKNGIAIGGDDPYKTIAMLCLFGHEAVRRDAWAALFEGLAQADPVPERKTASVDYLAKASELIPVERVDELVRIVEKLREGPSSAFSGISFSGTEPLHPACDRLLISLKLPGENLVDVVADLVARPPEYRRFAIKKMAQQPGYELLLLALSRDADPATSLAALCGLARRATEETAVARWAVSPLMQAIREGGERVATRIGGGVLDAGHRCSEIEPLIDALLAHESAVIRHLGDELRQ